MKNNCACQHYVSAHPWGSSKSGYGCLATGGHCLPDHECESLEKDFLSKSNLINSTEINDEVHFTK